MTETQPRQWGVSIVLVICIYLLCICFEFRISGFGFSFPHYRPAGGRTNTLFFPGGDVRNSGEKGLQGPDGRIEYAARLFTKAGKRQVVPRACRSRGALYMESALWP
jgi:hypothetical protein